MNILVKNDTYTVEFELNETSVSKDFLKKLPMAVIIENFGDCEKTFIIKNLDVSAAEEKNCPAGTLAYYAPWGKIALLYDNFSAFPELYVLGHAVAGKDAIAKLYGKVEISVCGR
ncbi:MAG: cyclophilin-like fold protein [Treponema sp.]|jgi:hypothetical protein|nr:cyclophilin-like fold protein [Treponema sp.]